LAEILNFSIQALLELVLVISGAKVSYLCALRSCAIVIKGEEKETPKRRRKKGVEKKKKVLQKNFRLFPYIGVPIIPKISSPQTSIFFYWANHHLF
jgi:hypothetical protein